MPSAIKANHYPAHDAQHGRRPPSSEVNPLIPRGQRTMDNGDVLTLNEAAALLRVHPVTLRKRAVAWVGSSRVDLQACKLEYSIVSPK